jgi:arginine exporter protein ArgO
MDKPEKLVLDDGSYFSEGRIGVFAGVAWMIFLGALALIEADVKLKDLVLPCGALSIFWLGWVAINTTVGLVHRNNDRRAINRLFKSEAWLHWQFPSAEWQGIVDVKYQSMLPEEGLAPYIGAVYSTIAGLVISVILILVGKFVIKYEEAMPMVLLSAGAVLLLMVGVGLFQPIQQRNKARKYRRKALRVSDPRVWFGAEGVYHEVFGYTSLKELEKITDHTRSAKTIKVKITMGGTSGSTYSHPVSFAVPSGCEQQASELVCRYRQERLSENST